MKQKAKKKEDNRIQTLKIIGKDGKESLCGDPLKSNEYYNKYSPDKKA